MRNRYWPPVAVARSGIKVIKIKNYYFFVFCTVRHYVFAAFVFLWLLRVLAVLRLNATLIFSFIIIILIKMVLIAESCGNTFVGGTWALPSALLVIIRTLLLASSVTLAHQTTSPCTDRLCMFVQITEYAATCRYATTTTPTPDNPPGDNPLLLQYVGQLGSGSCLVGRIGSPFFLSLFLLHAPFTYQCWNLHHGLAQCTASGVGQVWQHQARKYGFSRRNKILHCSAYAIIIIIIIRMNVIATL